MEFIIGEKRIRMPDRLRDRVRWAFGIPPEKVLPKKVFKRWEEGPIPMHLEVEDFGFMKIGTLVDDHGGKFGKIATYIGWPTRTEAKELLNKYKNWKSMKALESLEIEDTQKKETANNDESI